MKPLDLLCILKTTDTADKWNKEINSLTAKAPMIHWSTRADVMKRALSPNATKHIKDGVNVIKDKDNSNDGQKKETICMLTENKKD